MAKLVYRDYQKEAAIFLTRIKKGYCCLDCGLGKTAVAIAAAQLFDPILVVCPSVATLVWEHELSIWLKRDLKVQVVRKGKDKIDPDANIVIMSFGIATKKEKELAYCTFKTIIVDEAHYLKSVTAKRTIVVTALIKRYERAYCLTGTPMPNRPLELYPVLNALGVMPMNYYAYGKKFCAGWQPKWLESMKPSGAVVRGWDFTGHSNMPELSKILGRCMYRKTKEQVESELPDKTFQVISLDLKLDKQEKAFSKEDISYAGDPIGFTGLSEILHMQGLSKVPKVVEYVKDQFDNGNVKKVIVFCKHKKVIAKYVEKLKNLGVVTIDGSTPDRQRKLAVEMFQNDPSKRVAVLQMDACCTALTLTAANMVLFAETSWSPMVINQASDRAHRIGQTSNVLVQFLVVSESIDEYVLLKVLKKMKVIDKVVDSKVKDKK